MGREAPEGVPGTGIGEQAVRVAGALAEIGVGLVVLIDESGTARTLRARQSDLPGEITRATGRLCRVSDRADRGRVAPQAALVCPEAGVCVWLTSSGLSWSAADEAAARAWRAVLGSEVGR